MPFIRWNLQFVFPRRRSRTERGLGRVDRRLPHGLDFPARRPVRRSRGEVRATGRTGGA
ncbi:MAG: hypothetical protein KAX76_08065 [Comamonas sp.]|nr:hypothetical protein [Comamonas sp.]